MSTPGPLWLAFALLLAPVAALATLAWPVDAANPARRWRTALLVSAAALTLALCLLGVAPALRGEAATFELLRLTPQVPLALRADALGSLYALSAAGLWLLALIYALGYLQGPNQARTYAALLVGLGAAIGVAYAANLLTFFVFYELLSVLTYLLVIHDQTPRALSAGLTYLVYVLVGGSLVLAGTLVTFAQVGDLSFQPGGSALAFGADPSSLTLAFLCFLLGFGVKAALMPLHGWVAEAHPAAPAPCSALLSGVLVAAGAFGLLRVSFDILGLERLHASGLLPWLALASGATVIVAALRAWQQDDLKRRLAYSTVSQLGYVTLALAQAAPLATLGALVHVVHHAFMKGALFFCAGSFAHVSGRRGMAALAGMSKLAPFSAAAFTLAALGLIGVPPLAGFVSKWWLGLGMLDADAPGALVVLLVGALLAAAYLLPVVYQLYLAEAPPPSEGASGRAHHVDHKPGLVIAIAAAVAVTVLLGLAADATGFPLALARQAVSERFGGG